MKLIIGDKINYHRKKKNMTQEDLANMVGISAQAVSGWERNCGYPDITLLPGIARALGITIDELMGNDEIGISEDISKFYDEYWKANSNKRLEMAIEYYRKYPDVYDIADTLIMTIADGGFASEPVYYSLLCEACERVIANCTNSLIRYRAISAMSRFANDSEAHRWLDMNPQRYCFVRDEVYEERLVNQGKKEEASEQKYKNRLSLMLYIISKSSEHFGDPQICVGHNEYLRKLICTFGENGEIPDGWMGKYAFITLRNAAGLFGMGRNDEGFEMLYMALDAYRKQFSYPDETPLDLGNPWFFGNICLVKHYFKGLCDSFSDKNGQRVKIQGGNYYTQNPAYLFYLLTEESGWEWFDPVREDQRFKKAVEIAKQLNDDWVAEISGSKK